MPKDHPELARARELGIPVIRRAEALGEVTAERELVGVAGTHGKTTTTVMTADALAAAGRDPTALVGGRVAAWDGNLLAGGDRLYVVEADEYDRSFLALTPTVAVVTNIEADHLDIYADLADIKRTFAQFVRGARTIVLCADDAGANSLATPSSTEVIRYGVESPDARLVARDRAAERTPARRSTSRSTTSCSATSSSRVPGRHNVLNALAALGERPRARRDFVGDGARARGVRRRRAPLPAAGRRARRDGRGRLRAITRPRSAPRSRPRAPHFPGAGSSPRFSRTSSRARATSRGEFGTSLADGGRGVPRRDLSGARAADRRA